MITGRFLISCVPCSGYAYSFESSARTFWFAAFLMTAADAPIREAGGYLPMLLGAVFTWSTAKANLMERDREVRRNARTAFTPSHAAA